ncbi:hypothetical protein ACHAWF_003500 [Thalassiosira exigua]
MMIDAETPPFKPVMHPGSAAGHPAATNPNASHGTKRLASCREELERSWQGANFPCVSDGDSFSLGDEGRAKRRRTLAPSSSSASTDDEAMDGSFVKGTRISPTNRPPRAPRPASDESRPKEVKAGWYEGEVDALGNRHGRGVTKHDDGTEYEGPYVRDVMEGPGGRYQFVTTLRIVPDLPWNGSHLHRRIEKSFVGSFRDDMPHGVGMFVTKTVDCAPQVLGSKPLDVRFMEVVYDVGVHKGPSGKAVGEGMRIIYTATYAKGKSSLEETCYRLYGGEVTSTKVAHGYAAWMLQCMDLDYPVPPSVTL